MTEMVSPAPVAATRAALVFIYATVLIDALAFGIIIPVLPLLVQDFVGEPAMAAEVYGLFGTVWAVMQFICSPPRRPLRPLRPASRPDPLSTRPRS